MVVCPDKTTGLKKYWYYSLLGILLLAACGGARVTPFVVPPNTAPAAAEEAPAPVLPGEIEEEPPVEEVPALDDVPDIPLTVYQPYLRREEVPAPALPIPNNNCHLAVEVRNYDGVDGCGILLESDEGNLFLVGATPRGDPLEAGTRISIGYELMRGYEGSNCANADAVIRITCKRLLRVSSGVPRPVVCEAYDKPSKWLYDLAVGYGATYVTRFPWRGGRYVYFVETPSGQYLYDCRGYQICQPRKNCLGFIDDFSQGVVIYEGK